VNRAAPLGRTESLEAVFIYSDDEGELCNKVEDLLCSSSRDPRLYTPRSQLNTGGGPDGFIVTTMPSRNGDPLVIAPVTLSTGISRIYELCGNDEYLVASVAPIIGKLVGTREDDLGASSVFAMIEPGNEELDREFHNQGFARNGLGILMLIGGNRAS